MSVYLPQYTDGIDCYDYIGDICRKYGKTCVIIHGEKAFKASKDELLPKIEEAGIAVLETCLYGHEATYENVDKLVAIKAVQDADMIFGVGGGKCLDTTKMVAHRLNKPVFTFPTIASTCAAVTKISIMYNEDSSFRDIFQLTTPPKHCFINTNIIANAPEVYLWAGIGDTLAKYVESTFSARNDVLTYTQEFGINAARLCFYPIIENGVKALEDAKKHVVSPELEKVAVGILVSTGTVSITVGKDYNSALAHALNYGFTSRKHIEERHLHGEVVSYGTLVELMMDNQTEDLRISYDFYKKIGLPTCLKDLEFDLDDPLDDVLSIAVVNSELEHTPYKVTKEMIRKAMLDLEEYR